MQDEYKPWGHPLEDPNPHSSEDGRPHANFASEGEEILQNGRKMEIEVIVTKAAYQILKWGKILAWAILLVRLVTGIAALIMASEPAEPPLALLTGLGGALIGAVFRFFLTLFASKLIWAGLLLFVNISTTLKRIENKLQP